MSETPAPRAQAAAIQHRLSEGLGRIDPHHRLLGRPVAYRIIDSTTLEITYRDVPGIAEAEVRGVKRLIGAPDGGNRARAVRRLPQVALRHITGSSGGLPHRGIHALPTPAETYSQHCRTRFSPCRYFRPN